MPNNRTGLSRRRRNFFNTNRRNTISGGSATRGVPYLLFSNYIPPLGPAVRCRLHFSWLAFLCVPSVDKALSGQRLGTSLTQEGDSPFTFELLNLMNDLKPWVPATPPLAPIDATKLRKLLGNEVGAFGKGNQQVHKTWYFESIYHPAEFRHLVYAALLTVLMGPWKVHTVFSTR